MSGKIGAASYSVLLVDGYDFLAGKLKGLAHKVTANAETATGLGDTTENALPTGLSKLTITQTGGFFDDAANGMHAAFAALGTQARLLMAAFAGNTIGKPFIGASGFYEQTYNVQASVNALTKADATYNVSGTIDDGVIVSQSVSKTASWNTKTDGNQIDYTADSSQTVIPVTSYTLASPSVVTTAVPHGRATGDVVLLAGTGDITGQRTVTVISATTFSVGAASATGGTGGTMVRANTKIGGCGYQMVSAMSGFTGFVGKIRDSPDDITYSDLITFTNVTASPAAERIALGTTATINRYVSYTGTVTGSGSITVLSGICRGQ